MLRNEPRGCVFWFQVPYLPVDTGSANDTDIVWDADSDLNTCLKNVYDDVAQRQEQQAVSAVERVPSGGTPCCCDGTRPSSEGKSTVLFIEDDVPTRKLMTRGLEKKGFVVEQAANGAEGLEALKSRRFNMVLCDIMMPVMDGLECMKRFRLWEQTTEATAERRARGPQVRTWCTYVCV